MKYTKTQIDEAIAETKNDINASKTLGTKEYLAVERLILWALKKARKEMK